MRDSCGACFFGAHDCCTDCRCGRAGHCTTVCTVPTARTLPPTDGTTRTPLDVTGPGVVGAWYTRTVSGDHVREEWRVRLDRSSIRRYQPGLWRNMPPLESLTDSDEKR